MAIRSANFMGETPQPHEWYACPDEAAIRCAYCHVGVTGNTAAALREAKAKHRETCPPDGSDAA